MTRRTSFLTRCFALVLALVMTFSGSNLGIVLQAFAMEAPAASGNIGSLMVKQYQLDANSNFAKLLMSDGVAGNYSYTYNPPTDADALITIDAATRTVKVKAETNVDGHKWTANKTAFVFNVVTNEAPKEMVMALDGDCYVGTYDYTEPVYVEVKYNSDFVVIEDSQIYLEECIKTLKTGYNNVAQAAALNMRDVQVAIETMYPQVPQSETALRTAFENAGAKVVGIQTSIANIGNDYVAYLLANKGAILADVTATSEALAELNEQLAPYADALTAKVPELEQAKTSLELYNTEDFAAVYAEKLAAYQAAVLAGGADSEEAKTAEAELAPYVAAETIANKGVTLQDVNNQLNAEKIFTAYSGKLAEGVAALNAIPDVGWDISAAVAANADTGELNSLLAGDCTIPNYSNVDIILSKTLVAETDVATLTVKGSYSFYKNGALQTPPAMDPIEEKVAEGVDDEAKLAKVAPIIESFKNGLAKNLKGNGFTAEEVEKHFECKVDNSVKNVWNVTYAPKQYAITYGYETNEPTELFYGQVIDLPVLGEEERAYEYTVNGELYEEGKTVTVDGPMTITRAIDSKYIKTDLFEQIKKQSYMKDDAVAQTILDGLKNNRDIKYREPGDAVLSLNESTLNMPAARSSYSYAVDGIEQKWTAFGYQVKGSETYHKLAEVRNEDKSVTDNEINDETAYINVDYELLLASASEINARMADINTVIKDANAKNEALLKLCENKAEMETLDYGMMGTVAIAANGSDDLTPKQEQAFVNIQKNCYDGDDLTLLNLVKDYEAKGLAYYYTNAEAYLEAVEALNEQLVILLDNDGDGDGLAGFFAKNNYAGYEEKLEAMRANVQKATETLVLNKTGLIADDANLNALAGALTDAISGNSIKQVAENAPVLVAKKPLRQTGKNSVTLTIEMKAGNLIEEVKATYTKEDGKYVLTASDITKLMSEAKKTSFYTGDYAKYYNGAVELEAGMELTTSQTLTFEWTPKTYTVYYEGGSDTFTIANTKATLPAATDKKERYEYDIDGEIYTGGEYAFTREQIDKLFAVDGTYTVERTLWKNISYGFTLTVDGMGEYSAFADQWVKNGESYTVTEGNIDALDLQVRREIGVIQGNHYDQESQYTPYEDFKEPIYRDTLKNYSWTYIPYTVTVKNEAGEVQYTKTITLGNSEFALEESMDPAVQYVYLLDGNDIGDTFKATEGLKDYTIVRKEIAVEIDDADLKEQSNLLDALAKEEYLDQYIKNILDVDAFRTTVTIEDGKEIAPFDETVKYNFPGESNVRLNGTELTINASVTANKTAKWNVEKYQFDDEAPVTYPESKPNPWKVDMDTSVASAVVTYQLALADQATVREKLAGIDALIADGADKKASMDGLVAMKDQLSQLQTAVKVIATDTSSEYRGGNTRKEYQDNVVAVFADIYNDCYITYQEEEDGELFDVTELALHYYVKGYEAASNKLAYFYKNSAEIKSAIDLLIHYMDVLMDDAHRPYVDKMDTSMAGDALGGMAVSQLISDKRGSIAVHQDNMKLLNSVDPTGALEKLGEALEAALRNGYTGKDAQLASKAEALLIPTTLDVDGQGNLTVTINLNIEGYATISLKSDAYEVTDGKHTMKTEELEKLKTAIQAKLDQIPGINLAYETVTYQNLTEWNDVAIDKSNKTWNYTWELKDITVQNPAGTATPLEYSVNKGDMRIVLPAAADGQRWEYKAGTELLTSTKEGKSEIYSISVVDLYTYLGYNRQISCTAYEPIVHTFKLVVEGKGETEVLYEKERVVGATHSVNKTSLDGLITAALGNLGYNELAMGGFYKTNYSVNALPATLTETGKTTTYTWNYKNFNVIVPEVEGTQTITVDNRKITLAVSPDEETTTYVYQIDGKSIVGQTEYEFTEEQLLRLFKNSDTITITLKKVDNSGEFSQNVLSGLAAAIDNEVAAGVLNSDAFVYDFSEIVKYNKPTADAIALSNGILTLDEQMANATMNWVPFAHQVMGKDYVEFTQWPIEVEMGAEAKSADVYFKLNYMNAAAANTKLAAIEKLVKDAQTAKSKLDELSTDGWISENGKFSKLKNDVIGGVLSAISGGEFSTNAAENEAYRKYYTEVFSALSAACYPKKDNALNLDTMYLTLHGLLNNYRDQGMLYYFENASAFEEAIVNLDRYLGMLLDENHLTGLEHFLTTQGFGEYISRFDEIQKIVSEAAVALKASDIIDSNSANLGKLVIALEPAYAKDYEYQTVAFDANENLYLTEKVTKTNDGIIALTAILSDVSVNTDNVDTKVTILRNKDEAGNYVVTAEDIAELKEAIEKKAEELGFNELKFREVSYAELDALRDNSISGAVKEVNVKWVYKEFEVPVDDESVEIEFNAGNTTVKLPTVSEDGVYSYSFNFSYENAEGKTVVITGVKGNHTFTEEQLNAIEKNTFKVEVVKTNMKLQKLENFVASLNSSVGVKDAFKVVYKDGEATGISGTVPASQDAMMGLMQGLVLNGVYKYVGLDEEPLVETTTNTYLIMQTLLDAVMRDENFGSQSVIDMVDKKTGGHLLKATMQLGEDSAEPEWSGDDLTFEIKMVNVPGSAMAGKINTAAAALKGLKDVITFSGNPATGLLNVDIKMGNVDLNGTTVNMEKVYELYLTALIATNDFDKYTANEINQAIAFEMLKHYTEAFVAEGTTTKTYENTLEKLGISVDLSAYESYFQMMKRFYNEVDIVENKTYGASLDGEFQITTLLNLAGMDPAELGAKLSVIKEYNTKEDLFAGVTATMEHADKDYEAAILDPRNSSAQNKADYTLDLSKRAQSIGGESVIMLLKDVNDTIVLNNATILDLNGYSVKEIKANGRVIIIDSGSNGSVGSYSGNVTMLADNYTLDIETMVRNGYYESALLVAAEKAVSIALNNYASAAFYACADGGKLNTLYELGFDDFIDLIDSEEGSIYEIAKALLNVAQQRNKESVKDLAGEAVDMKDSAVKIVNAILDMFTMGTDGSNTENGLEALINEIAAVLIDVDKVADLTKTGGNLTTVKIATKPWKFYTDHVEGDDYITAGLIADPDAALRMVDFTIKVPKIENAKIQRVLNEMADIASGTAGNPDSYFEVDLQDIELADNTVTLGGGLKAKIALNFCSDEGTVEDFTDHGYYNRLFAAIMAYGNSERTKDYIKNGEFVDIHELLEITTVQEFFDAIQNAVESDKPFDFVIEKIGAKLSEQEIAKLSKLYEKFQSGVGKVLAKVEPKLPAAATFLSDHIDENGVFQLKSATYAGVKGISYKGYGLNFNLTETSAELWIKFCVEDEYKLVFVNNVGGMTNTAVTTIDAGDTFYIMDKAYQLDEDALYKLDKESYEAMVANLTLAGGNFALTYTPKTVKTATNTSIEAMGTPNDMFIWHITKHPTDSKTLVATRKAALDNMLYYQSSGILVSSSNELAMRFQYTVKGIEGDGVQDNADTAAINALAEMGYVIGEYTTPEGAKDSHGKPIEQKTGADVGMVTMFNGGYADKAIPSFDVYEEGNRDSKNGALEPFRTRMNGNYVAQWFDLNNEYLNGDQNIRFYAVLQQIKLDANGQPELDKDGKPVLVEKTKDNETKVAVYTDILTRDIRYVAEQTVGKETGVRKNMIQNLINRAIAAAK